MGPLLTAFSPDDAALKIGFFELADGVLGRFRITLPPFKVLARVAPVDVRFADGFARFATGRRATPTREEPRAGTRRCDLALFPLDVVFLVATSLPPLQIGLLPLTRYSARLAGLSPE